ASEQSAPTPARTSTSAPRKPQLEAAGFGTWEWTLASDDVIVSPAAETIHGLKPGSFGGTFAALSEWIHPDDHDRVLAACFQIVASGTDQFVDYRPRHHDAGTDADTDAERVLTWISPRRTG